MTIPMACNSSCHGGEIFISHLQEVSGMRWDTESVKANRVLLSCQVA